MQQLRAAFPEAGSYRYVILDRDAKFDDSVTTFLQATGLTPKRTSVQAPWQNGTAERWIGSCRRELQYHFDRRVADLTAAGIPDPEARRHVAVENDIRARLSPIGSAVVLCSGK